MAPPLQAIVLAASSILVIVSSSAELGEPPSPRTTAADSATLHPSDLLYTMQFRIGSTEVSGIADTGSDLIWTNNAQLLDAPVSCPFDAGEEKGMNCCNGLLTFKKEYGCGPSSSYVKGVIEEAKLTFEGQSSYTLNIGGAIMGDEEKKDLKAYAKGGMVGLGRGKMSLVSQLRLHSFSYCLPNNDHISASQATGQIKFNDAAGVSLEGTTELKTIKGLPYPASSRYYVGLKEIQVGPSPTNGGPQPVSLPNGCFEKEPASGNGGMVIDSGSAFTSLPDEAFNGVREKVEELINKNRKPGEKFEEEIQGNKLTNCYPGTYPKELGNIVLRFCDNAEMEIPAKNYFYQKTDKFCLALKKQDMKKYNWMSILGAYQQRGMHMLFDLKKDKLSFAKRSTCGQPQEEDHATM